MSVSTIYNQRL